MTSNYMEPADYENKNGGSSQPALDARAALVSKEIIGLHTHVAGLCIHTLGG